MILNGMVFFDMQIQEYSNFLKPEDVVAFAMIENCGCAGTMFEMTFQTTNEQISNLIIENNEVVFKLGESPEKATSYKAYISEVPERNTNAEDSAIVVSFIATLIDMQFYTTKASETVFGTSLDMVKKMATTYLGTTLDVQIDTPAETEHNWLRSYETGAITMMEAWLHMHLPNTTPIMWIDTNKIAHISDIERIKKGGVKHRFVPATVDNKGFKPNDIPYLNNFTTQSYKFDTNLVTGKNSIVNISSIESGNEVVHVPEIKPDIASTTKVEEGTVGTKTIDNKYQTDNVHNKFMVCYYTNKLRLIQLSSHVGNVVVLGMVKDVHLCDFVEVIGCASAYNGRYLVNTKITSFGLNNPIKTTIALCRDNINNIENADITPKSQVKIRNQQLTDMLQDLRMLRRVTVMGTKWLDGTMKRDIIGYCKTFKYNALNSFQVLGSPLNLNGSLNIMESIKNMGINIIKKLIDKYVPYPFNLLLHDAILYGANFKKLLSKYIFQYAPPMLRDFIIEILGLLDDLTCLMDALHKQNSKQLSNYQYTSGGYSAPNQGQSNASGSPSVREEEIPSEKDSTMAQDYTQQNTENIAEITDEFIKNVDGLDIPIPDVSLNESESLLPKDALKEVIAEKVVEHLDGQGYLIGIGKPTFLAILLGKKPLDFNTIKLINGNIGNMLYARYWGIYEGKVETVGRISDITNKIVTIPKVDATENVFNGDLITISGTDKSNGTYTVVECTVEFDMVEGEPIPTSYVKILEDIEDYQDAPMYNITTLCNVESVEAHRYVEELEDITVITIKGNYANFLKAGMYINITNLGIKGTAYVIRAEYNKVLGYTYVYVRNELIDRLNEEKKLQIMVATENGTMLSKLSNHDLTEFFIKNGFKDIYTTVPCTKTINAQRGAKVWIALPSIEEDLDFYINSKKVDMDIVEGLDLNLYATGGAKLWYTLYLSKDTYNSNNVTLEVRRKQ